MLRAFANATQRQLNEAEAWQAFTEREIPQSLVGNLRSLQGCWDTDNLPAVAVPQIERIEAELHRALSDKSIPLFQAALDCDGRLGFENGTSLLPESPNISAQFQIFQ